MKGFIVILLSLFLMFGCEENSIIEKVQNDSTGISGFDNFWAVDTAKMTGTSVRNTFPVVTDPSYSSADKVSLEPDDRVIVFKTGERLWVYPIRYMGIEVVNESTNDKHFAVTYCPITKSSVVWNRKVSDQVLTLAASGVLYQENLVPYDLETNSMWSQMLMKGIHGVHIFSRPEIYNSFETSWQVIKRYFAEARVFLRDKKTSQTTYKSEPTNDNRNSSSDTGNLYETGEKVFGVFANYSVRDNPVVYTKSHSDITQEISIDRVSNVIVVSSKKYNFIEGYQVGNVKFVPVHNEFPVIMKDENGIKYDVFGIPVKEKGNDRVKNLPSYSALWWAWEDFYSSFKPL